MKVKERNIAAIVGIVSGILGATVSAVVLYKMATEKKGEPGVKPGSRVLLIGDSIGVGIAPTLAASFAGAGDTFEARAFVGDTIQMGAARPDYGNFDAVLYSYGSNDAVLADPKKELPALQALKERYKGALHFWIVPPAFYARKSAKDDAIREMFESEGFLEVRVHEPPDVSQDPMRLHLTPNGYKKFAAEIFDHVAIRGSA